MKCWYTARCFLFTICILQVISTSERQLFDFMGRIWLPIICNFFNFIFVIFGFFGGYQYKTKYIIIYIVWLFFWLTWNAFLICFFLNVGILSNQSDFINFGTGSISWWQINGVGCDPVYPTNLTQVDVLRPLRPDYVKGCVLDYEYVETIHATFQCCFAIPGIIVSLYLVKIFSKQTEKSKKKPTSIYYVEYSRPRREESTESLDLTAGESYQQPMTPRKVKRHNRYRSSGRSQGRGTQIRGSQRQRRQHYLNPVTQLIDRANESSTSTDSYRPGTHNRRLPFGGHQGHSNPMYVHSRPNSAYSLNESSPTSSTVERPPSVHSSYSNYHGQRPSLNPSGTAYPTHGTAYPTHNQRKVHEVSRSTFKPQALFMTPQKRTESSFKPSESEGERPPPYMFGVNSETVI